MSINSITEIDDNENKNYSKSSVDGENFKNKKYNLTRRTGGENILKFMYTNIRSIMNNNKLVEIKRMLLEDNIDILGVTESWMREDINSAGQYSRV